MRKTSFIALSALSLASASAFADRARISALVLDDATDKPIQNVGVTATFWMETKWHQTNGGADPNIVHLKTDANGLCRASATTDAGHAGCYIQEPPDGYYRPLGGGGYDFTNKNFFGVWQPDNLVVTLRLQRVEHPLPLFVKCVGQYGGGVESSEDIFSLADGVLRFDLMKGEWLPPVGKGVVADMEFMRLPHEDFGEASHDVVKGLSYRDSMSVRFLGVDNGLVEMKTLPDAGLKVRTSPDEGFVPERICWSGVDKHLQQIRSYDKDKCFCFRIRTRRNDKGEIVEAYYGKIYGDIRMLPMSVPYVPVAAVRFTYYLNTKNLDRNLEWNRQNLCLDPIYPCAKDRWSYKSFNSDHAP